MTSKEKALRKRVVELESALCTLETALWVCRRSPGKSANYADLDRMASYARQTVGRPGT